MILKRMWVSHIRFKLSTKPKGFADRGVHSLLRALACGRRSHTGRLRRVFCEVHAPAKHGSDCFFALRGEKLCEAAYRSLCCYLEHMVCLQSEQRLRIRSLCSVDTDTPCRQLSACIPYASSISSSSSCPVAVKPRLSYSFLAAALSLLQVRAIRSESPKGFVRM